MSENRCCPPPCRCWRNWAPWRRCRRQDSCPSTAQPWSGDVTRSRGAGTSGRPASSIPMPTRCGVPPSTISCYRTHAPVASTFARAAGLAPWNSETGTVQPLSVMFRTPPGIRSCRPGSLWTPAGRRPCSPGRPGPAAGTRSSRTWRSTPTSRERRLSLRPMRTTFSSKHSSTAGSGPYLSAERHPSNPARLAGAASAPW